MRKIAPLAFKDYRHEWRNSACLIISLATVLGPILVLFGLKYGIVGTMVNDLINEPRNREISPVNSGRYNAAWFDSMTMRDDIEFIIPRTRGIATAIELKSRNSSRILDVQLVPTAAGDPLIPDLSIDPKSYDRLILSETVANKLNVKTGDLLNGSIARRFGDKSERVHINLTVQAIVSAGHFNQEGAFGSLRLLEALENYRDGLAVPELAWQGDRKREERYYPGFRLFANSIYDVSTLKDWFFEEGIEVKTKAHEIGVVQRLDQNLSMLYWAVAITGLVGCILSLGSNLWSNINRKTKELSVLRLVGFESLDIVYFPIVQGLITAIAGWFLAIIIYHLTSFGISGLMSNRLDVGQQVCILLPSHYIISLVITCVSVLIVSAAAGFRAAQIETADGLREQ